MLLARLAPRLLRAGPAAGCVRPRLALRGLPGPVCVAPYSAPPTGNRAAVSGPGKGLRLELEDMLVPRKMSISPLESWLTARCLLPGLHAEAPGNVLKIRRRKMNHHKYRKLVKRTRFLRRKVREGRLRQKQVKFERDLRRVWQKAGLKEAPPGWQTPKIYLKGK